MHIVHCKRSKYLFGYKVPKTDLDTVQRVIYRAA